MLIIYYFKKFLEIILNFFFVIHFRFKYHLKFLKSTERIEFDQLKINDKLVFYDDFNNENETKKKWVDKPQWSRALADQDVIKTEWRNVEWKNSCLIIETKYEPTFFMDWAFKNGRYFNYTTAHLETNHLHPEFPTPSAHKEYKPFLKKYGLFEAKVMFDMNHGGFPAFWLMSETHHLKDGRTCILPEIDIYEYLHYKPDATYQRSQVTYHWGNSYEKLEHKHNATNLGRINLGGKFYIFGLKWTTNKLIWYINNCPVKIQLTDLPKNRVYPIINGSVTVNGAMKHYGWHTKDYWDWVRIYDL